MKTALLISIAIALIQTAGAYLRYLPFKTGMTAEEKSNLWQWLFTWAIISLSLNTVLLNSVGPDVVLYKAIMFFGWLPYFLISLALVRRPPAAHVFVLGMQCLWVLTLHTVASMLESLVGLPPEPGKAFFIHNGLYLALLGLLLPAERPIFQKLLPSSGFFATPRREASPLGFRWHMALLPLLVFIGASLPIADSQMLHSWQERLSRLSLPLCFFFVYRAMGIAASRMDSRERQKQESRLMRRQIAAIKEYNRLHEDRGRQVAAICQELKDSYHLLDEYLAAGDVKSALKHIEAQESRRRSDASPLWLGKGALQRLSFSPLINAALSIYVRRAEELGIQPQVKINLPEKLQTDESDLAVLLSNLLENAVEASAKEPMGCRAMSVIVEYHDGQCVMEITNRFSQPLALGANGLPRAVDPGHGLGMASLGEFAEKYAAYVDFAQEENNVRLLIYWEDKKA